MQLRLFLILNIFLYINCEQFPVWNINETKNFNIDILKAFESAISIWENTSMRIIGSQGIFTAIEKSLNFTKFSFELLTKEIFNSSRILSSSYVNVIMLEDFKDIPKIFHKNNLQYFRLDGFYILLSFNACNETNESKIFEKVWQQQIYNINLICKDDEEILMKTFVPYQIEKCGSTDSVIIDKFINYSWNNKNFFPQKFTNLFNCQLKVASFLYPPITMRKTLADGSFRYYGSEMEIVKELAQILHFNINHNYVSKTGSSGLLFDNGTGVGLLKQTLDGEVDMLMGFYYLTLQRSKFLSFTQSHYSIPLVIMIPGGQPYSAFEKLFQPFQIILWCSLLLTFAIGLVIITIINCQNKKIRNFVFGSKVTTPYFNLYNIFVNGFQDVLPKRTFARYVLMVFMLFCFVLRTLYQGSLYQFLQSDGTKPDMETIDEMMKNHYLFYIRETLEHNIKSMSFYNR